MQKRDYVASNSLCIDVVAFSQQRKNLPNSARLCEHVPYFGGRAIKAKVGVRPHTQYHRSAGKIRSYRAAFVYKNAFIRDRQRPCAPNTRIIVVGNISNAICTTKRRQHIAHRVRDRTLIFSAV